jgi:hypothetical protein
LRQERQLGNALGLDVDRRLGAPDDAAGYGAGDRAKLADLVLQKAPARAGVVGEGRAGFVGLARCLAGIERDVAADVVVAAEIVRAFGDDEPAFLRRRRRGDDERKQDERNCESADETPHGNLPGAPPLRRRV